MTFSVFFRDPHVDAASASASVSRGSRPLGRAPAWRETTKVSGPAATEPVDVVAQPLTKASSTNRNTVFIKCLRDMIVLSLSGQFRQWKSSVIEYTSNAMVNGYAFQLLGRVHGKATGPAPQALHI